MDIVISSPAKPFFLKGLYFLSLSLFLVSCAASVTVKPEVTNLKNNSIIVRGNVLYEGNLKYLPATVDHQSGGNTDLTIKYEYVVSYDGTGNAEILMAFVPTTILGTPTGGDDVIALGKLELFKAGKLIKTYVGEVVVSKSRSIFLGGVDKSELRRLALTSLKENIEIQMNNDFSFLSQI